MPANLCNENSLRTLWKVTSHGSQPIQNQFTATGCLRHIWKRVLENGYEVLFNLWVLKVTLTNKFLNNFISEKIMLDGFFQLLRCPWTGHKGMHGPITRLNNIWAGNKQILRH
mmetsp:Transcript_85576/g.151042  ORF Transcript_85576/g.151042 Transcript_85576/m.151042 type:complete len:113 (+) Transcript_85576:48-386(+)